MDHEVLQQVPKSNLRMAKVHSTSIAANPTFVVAAETASEPTSCWLPCHGGCGL